MLVIPYHFPQMPGPFAPAALPNRFSSSPVKVPLSEPIELLLSTVNTVQ